MSLPIVEGIVAARPENIPPPIWYDNWDRVGIDGGVADGIVPIIGSAPVTMTPENVCYGIEPGTVVNGSTETCYGVRSGVPSNSNMLDYMSCIDYAGDVKVTGVFRAQNRWSSSRANGIHIWTRMFHGVVDVGVTNAPNNGIQMFWDGYYSSLRGWVKENNSAVINLSGGGQVLPPGNDWTLWYNGDFILEVTDKRSVGEFTASILVPTGGFTSVSFTGVNSTLLTGGGIGFGLHYDSMTLNEFKVEAL